MLVDKLSGNQLGHFPRVRDDPVPNALSLRFRIYSALALASLAVASAALEDAVAPVAVFERDASSQHLRIADARHLSCESVFVHIQINLRTDSAFRRYLCMLVSRDAGLIGSAALRVW